MNILTKETPGKVMCLLGASLFSLALLFGISASGQSFAGTEAALPNPFGPDSVMAVLDNTSHNYSNFVAMNFAEPLQYNLALLDYNWHESLNFVADNSSDQILAMTGLSDLVWQEPAPMAHPAFHSLDRPQVAGAFIARSEP